MIRLLSIALGLLLFSCSEKDCKSFRNGTFKLLGENAGDIIIERSGHRQIERSEAGAYEHEFSINWIDDCNYELVFIETNKPSSIDLSTKDTLRVEITETEGKQCKTIARFNDLQFEVIQEKIY